MITEGNIPVSKGPEDITTKYLRFIRRVTKATFSFALSVSWKIARPRLTKCFPEDRIFLILYIDKFYYSSVDKNQIGLISDKKYEALYLRSCIVTGRNTFT